MIAIPWNTAEQSIRGIKSADTYNYLDEFPENDAKWEDGESPKEHIHYYDSIYIALEMTKVHKWRNN
jgi:hypothetical protein